MHVFTHKLTTQTHTTVIYTQTHTHTHTLDRTHNYIYPDTLQTYTIQTHTNKHKLHTDTCNTLHTHTQRHIITHATNIYMQTNTIQTHTNRPCDQPVNRTHPQGPPLTTAALRALSLTLSCGRLVIAPRLPMLLCE